MMLYSRLTQLGAVARLCGLRSMQGPAVAVTQHQCCAHSDTRHRSIHVDLMRCQKLQSTSQTPYPSTRHGFRQQKCAQFSYLNRLTAKWKLDSGVRDSEQVKMDMQAMTKYKYLLSHDRRHIHLRGCLKTHPGFLQTGFQGYPTHPASLSQTQIRLFSVHPQALVDSSPPGLRPYLRLIRLDKPIGTWLLYLPCTWSIALAATPGHLPDVAMLALFGIGAFLMRGAGCIINDLWDKDFDGKVERTKDRPLPSGQVTELQSLCFLGLHLSAALAVLLTLNWYSVILGLSSMGLVITYPLMKRFTHWPQAVLGLLMSWGCLLGWVAVRAMGDWYVLPTLYLAATLWTMTYDTIYSHQDKADDLLIGVKSSALRLGEEGTKPALVGFSSVMVACLGATGYLCDQTWPYYLSLAAVSTHLMWQISTVNLSDGSDCASKFRSNKHLGLLLLLGIISGNLLKEPANLVVKEDRDKEQMPEARLQ